MKIQFVTIDRVSFSKGQLQIFNRTKGKNCRLSTEQAIVHLLLPVASIPILSNDCKVDSNDQTKTIPHCSDMW
ncbi:hypothetical protein BDF14DRAFT_1786097 [Spinellus fusiger]|nr:hypothetical protein BDF14DRAFT_1786097 [Spinellus fusiger]